MTVLIWAGAVFLLLASLAPLPPKSVLHHDLPSHFVLQWAIGAAVLMVAALMFHVHGKIYLVLFASYLLCIYQLFPFLATRKAAPKEGPSLKILQTNIWKNNGDATALAKLIRDENPDIIAVDEVHAPFEALFEELKSIYPHQHVRLSTRPSFGIAVLSKTPLENLSEKYLATPEIPSIFFRTQLGGKTLDIVALHAANPLRELGLRDKEFEALAAWRAEENPPNLIVTGDLNATPYCRAFKKMTQAMNLTDARRGRGLLGSWPTYARLPFLYIPIDHALAGGGASIDDFKLGPNVGSDHLPLIFTVRC